MASATQSTAVPAHELVYKPEQLPTLRSNYGAYLDQSSVGWLKETSATTSVEEMRTRFDADGYLFVKGLIPREDILDVRQSYFEHLTPTGILKPGTSPRDGIFATTEDPIVHNGVGGSDLPEDAKRQRLLESAHELDVYLAFLKHPEFRAFIRRFMDWDKDVILKRTLLRHNVPNGLSTGIHYDRIFLRSGEDFLTAWVPLGDCTAQGGGLIYMEDSSDIGKAMEADFLKRAEHLTPEERISGFNQNMAKDGQLSHNVAELNANLSATYSRSTGGRRRWLAANYEAGDVVFHSPYTIHGAVKNEDPLGRIRLGTDLRFYPEAVLTSVPTSTATITGAASLAPVSSYSYNFTVTISTTVWKATAFVISSPVPSCSDSMCPSLNGKYCTDASGDYDGVLCDTRFSGTVITNSGKKMIMACHRGRMEEGETVEIDKRAYAGTLDNRAYFCD
ncbi:hypothetical protein LTR22_023298 [Elasticomyces elasticus]|nr:hypothetical protein LTR22_023298 [Elasticomyces elasticus]